jgi:Tfp pilus assembly protein PilE
MDIFLLIFGVIAFVAITTILGLILRTAYKNLIEGKDDLKDTKNLLIKLMFKFETFSDDTLAKFEDQQHQITFNLEQLQQEEALDEVEDGADETNEANGAQEVLNQEEQASAPSNESEAVP